MLDKRQRELKLDNEENITKDLDFTPEKRDEDKLLSPRLTISEVKPSPGQEKKDLLKKIGEKRKYSR